MIGFALRASGEIEALGDARTVALKRQRPREAEFPGNLAEAGREVLEQWRRAREPLNIVRQQLKLF